MKNDKRAIAIACEQWLNLVDLHRLGLTCKRYLKLILSSSSWLYTKINDYLITVVFKEEVYDEIDRPVPINSLGQGTLRQLKFLTKSLMTKSYSAYRVEKVPVGFENIIKKIKSIQKTHPNVVKLHASFSNNEREGVCWRVFYEPIQKQCTLYEMIIQKSMVLHSRVGGLDWYKLQNTTYEFPYALRISLLLDIAAGLRFLHQHEVTHGELDTWNILIDSDNHAVLSDYGFNRSLASYIRQGCDPFMPPDCHLYAPEIFSLSYEKTKMYDIYQFGGVMASVLKRQKLKTIFAATRSYVIGNEQSNSSVLNDIESSRLAHLIQGCWQKDPNSRPSIETVCEVLHEEKLALK